MLHSWTISPTNAWVFVVSKSETKWWLIIFFHFYMTNCKWQQTLVLPTHCCLEVLFGCSAVWTHNATVPIKALDEDQTYCFCKWASGNWQRYVGPCDPWAVKPDYETCVEVLYNVSNFFVARPNVFWKENCETFYCLKQIATVPKIYKRTIKESSELFVLLPEKVSL